MIRWLTLISGDVGEIICLNLFDCRLQMNITGIAMKKFRKQKQKPRAQENISNSNDANKGSSSNENTNNEEDKLKPSITIEDLNGTVIVFFISNQPH